MRMGLADLAARCERDSVVIQHDEGSVAGRSFEGTDEDGGVAVAEEARFGRRQAGAAERREGNRGGGRRGGGGGVGGVVAVACPPTWVAGQQCRNHRSAGIICSTVSLICSDRDRRADGLRTDGGRADLSRARRPSWACRVRPSEPPLARLEQRLGARLLRRRTTRSLALTEAGTTFYRHARQVLGSLAQAEASVKTDEPRDARRRAGLGADNHVVVLLGDGDHVRAPVSGGARATRADPPAYVDLRREGYDVACVRPLSQRAGPDCGEWWRRASA